MPEKPGEPSKPGQQNVSRRDAEGKRLSGLHHHIGSGIFSLIC
jgi:hypothetical protein